MKNEVVAALLCFKLIIYAYFCDIALTVKGRSNPQPCKKKVILYNCFQVFKIER